MGLGERPTDEEMLTYREINILLEEAETVSEIFTKTLKALQGDFSFLNLPGYAPNLNLRVSLARLAVAEEYHLWLAKHLTESKTRLETLIRKTQENDDHAGATHQP